MSFKHSLLVTLLLISPISYAESAQQKLNGFLNKLTQMGGEFTQIVTSEQGHDARSAIGTFKVKKPGMFDWKYKQPYEQQIISNGKKIWVYDKDLEQLTVRQISESLNSSPLSIFVSETPVENIFSIEEIVKNDDIDWIKLTPIEESSTFEFIEIGFVNGTLSNMVLQDNFGQTTRLLFTQVDKDINIDSVAFEFNIPDGTDVFEEQ